MTRAGPKNQGDRMGSNGLHYPFEHRPAPGQLVEVASGVYWVRMPLPISLNHINLWVLEEADGWTIVDTGMATDETKMLWETIIDRYLDGKPIKNVIATHMHFDHLGLAGWLVESFGATLWMSRTEYLASRVLINEISEEPPVDTVEFFRKAGVEEAALSEFKERFRARKQFVSALPTKFNRLVDNQTVDIGAHRWKVVIGEGHSPEHVCLVCESLNIFIAGDQILPRISANIGVRTVEPHSNPLHDWLASCEKFLAFLNPEVMVLPSHGDPFIGAHTRIREFIDEHQVNLKKLQQYCAEPRSVVDTFPILFKSTINTGNIVIAVMEATAHLNYLVFAGSLAASTRADGITTYQVR